MTRHLIHIGYPKAGSTFLQRWFAGHPQLAYCDGGIAGFRDIYSLASAAALPSKAKLYRVTSDEGLSAPRQDAGEEVVSFAEGSIGPPARQAQACACLAALFPNATILIVTRGFRSMILSSYSQYVRSCGDEDFASLVAPKPGNREQDTGPSVDIEHWNYDRLIGTYEQAFGAQNVIVLPYELLRDDPGGFARALANLLSIDHFAAPPDRVNPTLSAEEMAWYPRLTRIARKLPRPLFKAYAHAVFRNRLGVAIRLLHWLSPAVPVSSALLPQKIVEGYRGCAESLRGRPFYGPYAEDYLLELDL